MSPSGPTSRQTRRGGELKAIWTWGSSSGWRRRGGWQAGGRVGREGATNMSEEHRSPLGPAIDSLASSYKQLLDATLALNVAEIPYAICGGFAVAAWCLYHEVQLLEEADPTRVVA